MSPSRTYVFANVLLLCVAQLVSVPTVQAATLKIATLAPDGTTWMREMRAGAEEIAERTQGRVKLKFYPGGIMGGDKSVLRKMRIGQLQGGAFTSGGLADVYPDIQIYSLPLGLSDYGEVDYVRARMDDLLYAGMERAGLVTLGISDGGFANIMCQQPIRAIGDLKGKKVWVPEGDDITLLTFKTAGISPVPLPLADVYTGLQTGLLDTVASAPTGAIAFQWHTKVKYLTDVPIMYLIGLLAVDRRAFGRLAPEDQKVVRSVMARIFKQLDQLNREDNEKAKAALARQGVKFVKPSAAELAHWHQVAEKARVKLEARGEFSREMFDLLQGHLQAYHSQARANGG
jgi:TRAP-type C4-dicarboxylate transport system substrate-binding protein